MVAENLVDSRYKTLESRTSFTTWSEHTGALCICNMAGWFLDTIIMLVANPILRMPSDRIACLPHLASRLPCASYSVEVADIYAHNLPRLDLRFQLKFSLDALLEIAWLYYDGSEYGRRQKESSRVE